MNVVRIVVSLLVQSMQPSCILALERTYFLVGML
jgi:hypothetical protein